MVALLILDVKYLSSPSFLWHIRHRFDSFHISSHVHKGQHGAVQIYTRARSPLWSYQCVYEDVRVMPCWNLKIYWLRLWSTCRTQSRGSKSVGWNTDSVINWEVSLRAQAAGWWDVNLISDCFASTNLSSDSAGWAFLVATLHLQ